MSQLLLPPLQPRVRSWVSPCMGTDSARRRWPPGRRLTKCRHEGILLGKGSRHLPCLPGHRAPRPSFLALPPFEAATPAEMGEGQFSSSTLTPCCWTPADQHCNLHSPSLSPESSPQAQSATLRSFLGCSLPSGSGPKSLAFRASAPVPHRL